MCAYSGGEVFVPANHLQTGDTREKGLQYLKFLAAGYADPELLENLLDRGIEAARWFGDKAGVKWKVIKDFPDYYYPTAPGTVAAGRYLEVELIRGHVLGDWRKKTYLSPHVRSWAERVRIDGAEAGLEPVLAAVRPAAERLEATQFEVLTAAAFVAFREAGVEAAVVEAGLGGRHDATNVLDATRVVVLTNVSLEHTEVLGATREAIAREKLAVVHPGSTVVLGEGEWEDEAHAAGAGRVLVVEGGSRSLATEASGTECSCQPAVPGASAARKILRGGWPGARAVTTNSTASSPDCRLAGSRPMPKVSSAPGATGTGLVR